MLLSMSLAAAPLLANDAKETGKEETTAAVTTAAAVPDQPVATVKPASSVIENEVQDLRSLVEEQRAELESQRAALKAQQLKMEELYGKLGMAASEPATAPAETPVAVSSEPAPVAAIGSASRTLGTSSAALAGQGTEKESPLYFKIGGAEFYPLGFMDMTNIYRSTNMTTQGGGSIGTSFNAIPFNNTLLGRVSEDKFSAQNSRLGLRTHAKFGEADVTGYLEADFLGYLAPSGNVTSNSDSLRLRLYWVDYRRGMWEVLGGQSWSLLTPNRNGLSALPSDLFYGQEMDTNYYLGLTYTRAAGIRAIVHPTKEWAFGVSFENPQQLLASTVTIPVTVPSSGLLNGQGNNYGGQFDSNSGNTSSALGVNNTSIPNLFPDVIAKTSYDATPWGHHFHVDLAGLLRTFKAVNLVSSTPSSTFGFLPSNTNFTTIHGGGVAATLNVELIKNLRFISTAYYSSGGGRYIGNTGAPDLIVKADGTLSGVKSGSGLAGVEWQFTPKWMFYGYYSGVYFGKDTTYATPTGGALTCYGYGCPGSSSSANRYLYEPEVGFINTMWRNPNYGDLKVITQFSYLSRTPWNVAVNTPATAHNFMMYIDLRYDLP
jgi:hypothetical protein